MKKFLTFFILFCCCCIAATADHITGGEMFYTYGGEVNGQHKYHFTLKLYMRCNSGRVFNNPTIISVFNKIGNRVTDIEVPISRRENLNLTDPDPCISNPPIVCYDVGYYDFTLTLPPAPEGYIVAGQVNFRVAGIANLTPGYSQVGATYTAVIPGTSGNITNVKNISAKFIGSDLVIVCSNNAFKYSFAATDDDGDELRYYFCEAYRSSSGPSGGGGNASPPQSPPYISVPYGGEYGGNNPLGVAVSIDSKTGLISGIAPGPGIYVVTVCVEEIRNGKVIAIQRKDLQVAITSCSLTAANLYPEYLLCRDTKTISLNNLSTSTLINDYYWELRSHLGNVIYTSKDPGISYTFPDTGVYQIKLAINQGQRCSDSTRSIARVYPGFKPAFTYEGICLNKPTDFRDRTTTVYGTVNSWSWNFDEFSLLTDTSTLRNPVYTYPGDGNHPAKLVAGNSNGCRDSVTNPVTIFEKPPISLAFRDTLICPPDQLQLMAQGRGKYTWTPNILIVDANTPTPRVSPLSTTTYYVELDDDGCINNDSVTVNVTNTVSLKAMNDTTICQGDPILLKLQSNGLKYSWTPASQLENAFSPNPVAISPNTTIYEVTAFISSCSAKDQVVVKTVPYPIADAGNDTLICFRTSARLNGATDAPEFSWSPQGLINNSGILNPLVTPAFTTMYYFTTSDSRGCPKAVTDSVLVTVLPDINPTAGPDTSIVLGETVQLNATGGSRYFWYPPYGLSSVNTASPVALFDEPVNEVHYTVLIYNEAGCVDSASITLTVFTTPPSVFVPTGFTPNNDGRNDLLRPIAVGMKKIERFSVYNRYGQQVFSTTINGMGWDGKINGVLQRTSVYVWMVQAVDFNGKKYISKGTSTLIR